MNPHPGAQGRADPPRKGEGKKFDGGLRFRSSALRRTHCDSPRTMPAKNGQTASGTETARRRWPVLNVSRCQTAKVGHARLRARASFRRSACGGRSGRARAPSSESGRLVALSLVWAMCPLACLAEGFFLALPPVSPVSVSPFRASLRRRILASPRIGAYAATPSVDRTTGWLRPARRYMCVSNA